MPPVLRRGAIAGYDAIMADPAGKIAQITRLTLRELRGANGSVRPLDEGDEDVLTDIEELLEE